MKHTLIDQLREQIRQLEMEYATLCTVQKPTPDETYRIADIQISLSRLRDGLRQLLVR